MHPGLVPGIGVEDQRNTFGVDKITFFTNAGWLLNVTMMMAIVTMAYIGFSRLGRIKLGTNDEEPDFG